MRTFQKTMFSLWILFGPIIYIIILLWSIGNTWKYPLVNCPITMERFTMHFSWVNPLFRLGHGFKFANCKRFTRLGSGDTSQKISRFTSWNAWFGIPGCFFVLVNCRFHKEKIPWRSWTFFAPISKDGPISFCGKIGKSSSLGKAIWKFWEINRIFWALELDRIGLEQLFLKNFELQERSVKCHWEDLIHEQKTKCWWINKRDHVNCFIRNY